MYNKKRLFIISPFITIAIVLCIIWYNDQRVTMALDLSEFANVTATDVDEVHMHWTNEEHLYSSYKKNTAGSVLAYLQQLDWTKQKRLKATDHYARIMLRNTKNTMSVTYTFYENGYIQVHQASLAVMFTAYYKVDDREPILQDVIHLLTAQQ